MKTKEISYSFAFFLLLLVSVWGIYANETGIEISTQKEKISCLSFGMVEWNDQEVIKLIFTNHTGKDISNVYGSLRIIDTDSSIVQTTGFTYSKPFEKETEKTIYAFRFIPLKEKAKNLLMKESEISPVIFILREIQYKDGKKEEY